MKAGLEGQTLEAVITRFFGDLTRWPITPDGLNFTQDQIRAICEHIRVTGDCLWHAQAVVLKWPTCHCAECDGGKPPLHPRPALGTERQALATEGERAELVRSLRRAVYHLASCWDALRDAEHITVADVDTSDIDFLTSEVGKPGDALEDTWNAEGFDALVESLL